MTDDRRPENDEPNEATRDNASQGLPPLPESLGQAGASVPPTPGQPLHSQPLLGQAAPGQPLPPGAYPPYSAAPPPKRGLGTGAIIGIVAGGIAVVVIVVLVIVLVVVRALVSSSGSDAGDSGDGTGGASASPSDAVTDYLTALSEGDADAALALLSSAPSDDTLLTDEVLAASVALAPISEIEVLDETVGNGSGDVTVAYRLGDTPVQSEFGVLDYDDDGVWQVTGGTSYLSVSKFDGLGFTVNGQPAEGDEFEVFPGAYQLATTLPNFALSGETVVLATEPFGTVDLQGIDPVLTDAATQQFRALVRSAVDACIASTTLAAGCGLDLPATLDDGTVLTDGTITRSLTADSSTTIDSLEPTLSYDNPTLAQGEFIGGIDVSAQCSQNGETGTCDLLFGPSLGQPSVDMASETPVVLWD
ncbi:hypothetical protein [Herbiconiux daphne]|uniref:DUF4878 domain-containing protein n=1 Tax=Herbiconiux daphne TaxID=2970914 RepID=A0ABT2H5W1_9MICO|nr:hypothetical protein [Herbiconiux daphne]MCS5735324.1 hypothetical protein [Herbiconiux daphne]